MRAFLASSEGKVLLQCWTLVSGLELWIYLVAFQDPFHQKNFVWEGPLSLLFFLLGLGFGARYLWKQTGRRFWLVILAIFSVLGLLPVFVALTPPRKSSVRLEVFKSERRLVVVEGDREMASYRVGLGHDPEGDKEVMSDGKTPIGQFYVCDKGPSQFHKWIGLNYPTADDAWRGRKIGKVTWVELLYIRAENLNGRIPYGNSALGGAIGIHGGGSDNDWTLGCIALSNFDIDEF